MQRETIYAAHRVQGIFGGLFLGALALIARSHDSNGLAIGLAAVGAFAVLLLLRRPRLEIDQDGLKVVNLLHTYRLRWTDIAGFGFGAAAMTSCLAIRRRDGTTVNAVVVSDDVRSGYSHQRVAEIVADLQRRHSAATGSSSLPGPFVSEQRARRNSLRVLDAMWLLLCAFFVIFGLATAWRATFDLPATYSRLSSSGVRATATFAGCRVTGIRNHECRLSLAYQGTTRTWNYSEDFPQFHGLLVGAVVPVLVDPHDSATVYTVHDVQERYHAGFGVLGIFGIALASVGAVGLVWEVVRRRRDARFQRALRPQPWS